MDARTLHINALLKQLPNLPGVYKMLDQRGGILYIGKAKNLKNRVSSYFKAGITHPKTLSMVAKINHIETILTRSETEALLLEQNLIKQNKPPFNIMLRDDKSYLYIYLSQHAMPRLTTGRGVNKQHIKHFFGPYPSGTSAREVVNVLHRLFQLRSCDDGFYKSRTRPCLEHQIKRCSAPCVAAISSEDYALSVEQAYAFLKGDTQQITQYYSALMNKAAEQLDFEKAAQYRDQLSRLSDVQSEQSVYQMKGEADVWAIESRLGVTVIYVLHIRGGRVLGGKAYTPDIEQSLAVDAQLSEFLAVFYFQFAEDIPEEVITNIALSDRIALADALSEQRQHKIQFKHNVRLERAEWLALAQMNVSAALTTRLEGQLLLHARFTQLEALLECTVNRIECFDISHTQGEETVASCVVFNKDGPSKKDYRSFNIKNIQAGDDYAAMRQALLRRYQQKSANELPDLVLIDGGKGQLTQAISVMQELEHSQVLLVGVSKGEGRKAGLETLHFVDGRELLLGSDHMALHLINYVRDEAHRFAILKHTRKRDKKRGQSVLEAIPGLGAQKRRALLTYFGGIQNLLGASEKDLTQVEGIGIVLAKSIYQVLH